MPRKGQYKNRVGEFHTMNDGNTVEVIKHDSSDNCTIKYEDGTLYENLSVYRMISKGIRKPFNREGEKYLTTTGENITIIDHISPSNVTVQLDDGRIIPNCWYQHVRQNEVRNPYFPANYGVGYLGVGKYKNTIKGKTTVQCSTWSGMFRRSYNEEERNKMPSYRGCSIDPRWHCLQDFGPWFDERYDPKTMKGWHIDKDILQKGNKIYSPEMCCLVPVQINSLFVKSNRIRGKYPIGVSLNKKSGKFTASIKRSNKPMPLGTFNTIEEAFSAYKTAKESWIKEVADFWRPLIGEQVYFALINYQVEITD